MMKRIVLCADDYGQAPAISEGIISLLEAGRLSAVSCMVTSPHWIEHANWLQPFLGKIDVGLHFNLTHGEALSPAYRQRYGKSLPTLGKALKKSWLRQWNPTCLQAECAAQIERFRDGLGCMPDFIDGHQHIHQFPLIREGLLAAYQQFFPAKQAFIRLVRQFAPISTQSAVKLLLINQPSFALKTQLQIADIPFNSSFSGIYPFSQSSHYGAWFPLFLKNIKEMGLIMCHPGLVSKNEHDPIAQARYDEYQYLRSNECQHLIEQQFVALSRFQR